jgi:hypothetical protein
MTIQNIFDSILAMKIVKPVTDFLFATILSVFLVFILMNIAYSKREEVKIGLMGKLSDFQVSLRELYEQGSSKALEYKLAYKNNKIT